MMDQDIQEKPDITEVIAPVIDQETANQDRKLMLKTRFKLIEASVATFIVMILIAINQGKKLFLFDFITQSDDDIDTIRSIFSGQIFGMIIYGFLAFVLAYSLYFWMYYQKRIKLDPDKRILDFSALKKRYDFYDLIGVVPVFLAVVVILNAFFFSPAIVHGPSMEPTFYENDAVMIYHFAIHYEHDDVIIYDRGDALLIKRLVALPGDMLLVNDDGVFVNGEKVGTINVGSLAYYQPYSGIIPSGYYYLLGDNAAESNDSRYFGLINEADLLGKVIVKINGSN